MVVFCLLKIANKNDFVLSGVLIERFGILLLHFAFVILNVLCLDSIIIFPLNKQQ